MAKKRVVKPKAPEKPDSPRIPGTAFKEFEKRCHSKLWRLEPGDRARPTFHRFEARVEELKRLDPELSHPSAVVRAAKEFPSLTHLFREYDLTRYDTHPDVYPVTTREHDVPGDDEIPSAEVEQTYIDDLRWAGRAAGRKLRTGRDPGSCPNDRAWYLYQMALDEGKDFLGKLQQAEAKDTEETSRTRKGGKLDQLQAAQIETMLNDTLNEALREGSEGDAGESSMAGCYAEEGVDG